MNEISPVQSFPLALSDFQGIARPKTYTELVRSSCVKLRPFSKTHGNDATQAIILSVLSGISESLSMDVSGTMLFNASRLILEDYPDTKLSALHFFAREVLSGRLGKKIYRWDTRVIMELWGEFYENMEIEYEGIRTSGLGMQDRDGNLIGLNDLKKVREMSERMKLQAKEEKEKIKFRARMKDVSFVELCESQGVTLEAVADAIRARATKDYNMFELDINFETFLSVRMAAVRNDAKKNPAYLVDLVNQK